MKPQQIILDKAIKLISSIKFDNMKKSKRELEIQELELEIIDKLNDFIEIMQFKKRLICYIGIWIMILRISKNQIHKVLIIKYNKELTQNLN